MPFRLRQRNDQPASQLAPAGASRKPSQRGIWWGVILHGNLVGRRRAGSVYFGAVPAVSAVPGPAFGDLPGAARTWGLGVGMGLGT